MINQYIQTVTLKTEVATAIAELQDFIAACRDAREARKAMAVKLVYQDYLYEEIQTILDVRTYALYKTTILCIKVNTLFQAFECHL